MKISNELKVALTIIAALILGLLGYRTMGDMPLFRTSTYVYTHFERADGLTAGNYIYLHGVKVGSVKKLTLVEGDSVEVGMTFDLDVNIPKNSTAYLQATGMLDEKSVIIETGDSNQMVEYGDTIRGVYRGGIMETLKDEGAALSEDVSESFDQLNSLLASLNGVVNEKTEGQLNDAVQNLQTTTNEIAILLENRRKDIESSIDHTNQFLANLDTVSTDNKERVDSVMVSLEKSMKEMEELALELRSTNEQLNLLLAKINNGEGSLGKMVNDPGLYNNLEKLSGEMNLLIKNINEDPGKYLKHMRLIEVF